MVRETHSNREEEAPKGLSVREWQQNPFQTGYKMGLLRWKMGSRGGMVQAHRPNEGETDEQELEDYRQEANRQEANQDAVEC